MQTEFQIDNNEMWLLLPPGDTALLRFPAASIPDDCRLATLAEVYAANLGQMFPWGQFPDAARASRLWQQHRIGFGGLYHHKWFITQQGRVGGADNVPKSLPGSLRHAMLLDGGLALLDALADNEGYALVRSVPLANRDFYRAVQMHAAEHVAADGGAIIVTPLFDGNKAKVGFVGRCQSCPNPELISFRQLQKAVPQYELELLGEWKGWSLNAPVKATA